MSEKIEIPRGTLSDVDIDVLSGMMTIFMHAADKCLRLIELHYKAEYRASEAYKRNCKQYGKAAVEMVMDYQTRKVVRHDDKLKLGRLIKQAEDFHRTIDSLTDRAMVAHNAEISDIESFNALEHDINYLCYMYALMGNCIGADDELKLLSTIKMMAKGDRVSDNVLSKLAIPQV